MLKIIIFTVAFFTVDMVHAQLKYPETKKSVQVDDYHGTKVSDPYRWLEEDNSAETKSWVCNCEQSAKSQCPPYSPKRSWSC